MINTPAQRKQKLLFIFGTRPEAIKMAPVILQALSRPEFEVLVCATGQHQEMLYQVLNFFKIRVDIDLKLMKHGQTLSSITADVIQACTGLFEQHRPSIVLVHGDTTTTFAAMYQDN